MWKRVLVVVLLAIIARHLFYFISILGLEKTIYNHRPGECSFVPGIESGSEDLVLLSDGTVLISSGYPHFKERVEGAPRGYIYAYDINKPSEGAKQLKISGRYDVSDLHPHGISAFEDKKTGKTTLFVISHHVGYDTVDQFEFDRESSTLLFIKYIRDPLMTSVNNLVAVGPEEFYITNEARTLNPKLRFWEDVLMLRNGYVLFCTTEGCRKVSESLNNPNGIDLSRDGRYLYVNQPLQRQILIFQRDSTDNSLRDSKPVQIIGVGTIPDNVYVDVSGDLWVGAIPVGYKALGHLDDSNIRVPSQVLRIKLGSGSPPYENIELNEVYSEDGRNLTMSTSALYHQNVLLIGTVHERMMHCIVKAF